MDIVKVVVFYLVYLEYCKTQESHLNVSQIKKLILFKYNPNVRPVLRNHEKININLSAALISIMDLDEKNQRLITNIVINMTWYDRLLNWSNVPNYNKASAVLSSNEIWTPDIYVNNNADDGDRGFLYNRNARILLKYTGEVIWQIPIVLRSSCQVNVAYFPFDNQICRIKLSSWTYDINQVSFIAIKDNLDIKNIMENTELNLINNKIITKTMYKPSIKKLYPQIEIKIHLSRKTSFYIYTVIIPSILLCFLTTFTFILPSNHGGKIEIGLTVFLFLYFLQLIISQNTPESNAMPVMGVFLFLIMTVNSISIIMSTIIVRIMYLTKSKVKDSNTLLVNQHFNLIDMSESKLPDLLWIFTKFLSKFTFMTFNDFLKTNYQKQWLEVEIRENVNCQRWRYFALVIDRLLFEIFAIGVLITLMLLLFVPHYSNKVNEF